MKDLLRAVWRWVRWPVYIVAGLALVFAAIVVWRIFVLIDNDKTKVDVARIHANKLTWSDINGELPPEPDPVANNATLAGVDSNQNGIRDDVERTIYLTYKDNQRTAIAMLQYAKELQMEFTEVRNSETLIAVIQEEGRGSVCVLDTEKTDEIRDLTFNTQIRKEAKEDLFRKYMTSYSLLNENFCDITF